MAEDDDTALRDRVEELESEVQRLTDRLAERDRQVSLLVAEADIDNLEATCPHCGEGTLTKRSGLSWSRVVCPECKTHWDT